MLWVGSFGRRPYSGQFVKEHSRSYSSSLKSSIYPFHTQILHSSYRQRCCLSRTGQTLICKELRYLMENSKNCFVSLCFDLLYGVHGRG